MNSFLGAAELHEWRPLSWIKLCRFGEPFLASARSGRGQGRSSASSSWARQRQDQPVCSSLWQHFRKVCPDRLHGQWPPWIPCPSRLLLRCLTIRAAHLQVFLDNTSLVPGFRVYDTFCKCQRSIFSLEIHRYSRFLSAHARCLKGCFAVKLVAVMLFVVKVTPW